MPQAFQSWYQHDINAWQGSAAVQDMNDAEYRAFHNLIMAQFQSEDGMLPDDDKQLAKLSRKRHEWESVREVVMEEFESMGDGRVCNVRMHKEWQRSRDNYDKCVRAGKASAESRQKRSATHVEPKTNASSTDVEPMANMSATDDQRIEHNTIEQKREEQTTARPAPERPNREPSEPEVDAVRNAYPRKTAPPEARKAIRKALTHLRSGSDRPAMTTSEALEFLQQQAAAYARSPAGGGGEFTPHAATWFNRGSYLEDPSEWQRSGDGGRGNGPDRQRNGNGGGTGSPAQQRVDDNRAQLAKAFARGPRAGGDGNPSVADGGELLRPVAGGGAGRVVDAAVVSHRVEARPAYAS